MGGAGGDKKTVITSREFTLIRNIRTSCHIAEQAPSPNLPQNPNTGFQGRNFSFYFCFVKKGGRGDYWQMFNIKGFTSDPFVTSVKVPFVIPSGLNGGVA